MSSGKTVTASFSPIMHSLTLDTEGKGFLSPETGAHNYAEGSEVTITAAPDSGWQFDSWSGAVADPDSAITTVVINSEERIIANFSQIMHPLTLDAEGNGLLSPEIGTYSYAEGTAVTITATPDSDWYFAGWIGEVSNPESATTTVFINTDKTVTANFSPNRFNPGIIGIITGSIGAGLATFFVTRRQKSQA
jgi:hypothetical protein